MKIYIYFICLIILSCCVVGINNNYILEYTEDNKWYVNYTKPNTIDKIYIGKIYEESTYWYNVENKCFTKPNNYKYKYCPYDGYIKLQNGYKIIHYENINNWLQSSNKALQIQGQLWYNIYLEMI